MGKPPPSKARITRGSKPTRERHRRVLIVTGGIKTEPAYLRFLKDQLGTSGVAIQIAESGRDPRGLVAEAVAVIKQDKRDARRSGDRANTFDSAWVMTDVDDFGTAVPEAVAEAVVSGVEVAVSNPCFELWLLWHVADKGGYITTKNAQAAARQAGVTAGKNGKELVVKMIEGNHKAACGRAAFSRTQHAQNGVIVPHDNPSSGVDRLVDDLLAAARAARPGTEPALD